MARHTTTHVHDMRTRREMFSGFNSCECLTHGTRVVVAHSMLGDVAWPEAVTRALAASPAPAIQVGTPFFISLFVAKTITSLAEAVGGVGMVLGPVPQQLMPAELLSSRRSALDAEKWVATPNVRYTRVWMCNVYHSHACARVGSIE